MKNFTFVGSANLSSFMMRIVTFCTIFLLSFNFSIYSQTELIQNGDFAEQCCSGISWNSSPDFYYNINHSNWHSAPGYAYMASQNGSSGNNLSGGIWQDISNVPNNIVSARISFWYSISTSETTSSTVYDFVNVYLPINGTNWYFHQISNLDDTNGNYVYFSQELTSDAINALNNSSTAQIQFIGITDGASPSIFRIDDVSLEVVTENEEPSFDLFTSNPNISESTATPGDIVNLSCHQNITAGCCDNSNLSPRPEVGFYFSTDTYLDANDLFIDSQNSTIGRDNDLYDPEDINFEIPIGTPSGIMYVLFVPDYNNVHEETSESDYTYASIQILNSPMVGAVTVEITPGMAIIDGGQWNLDGGSWKNSEQVISDVSVGQHVINFKNLDTYITPENQVVNVQSGQTVSRTGYYGTIPIPHLTNPNGGEQLNSGDIFTITGNSAGDFNSKKLEFSNDNGQTWSLITTINSSLYEFSYDWTVPFTSSTTCKVRLTIIYNGGSETDESDNIFTIENQTGQSIYLDSNGGVSHLYYPFYNSYLFPDGIHNTPSIWQGQEENQTSTSYTWQYTNTHGYSGTSYHHSGDKCFGQDWNINSGSTNTIDNDLDDCGDYFFAPLGGTVIEYYAGCNPFDCDTQDCNSNNHSFGNYVVIETINHDGVKFWFRAGHFMELNPNIGYNSTIIPGQWLGKIGNEGNSTGPHIHVDLIMDTGSGSLHPISSIQDINILPGTSNFCSSRAANFKFDVPNDDFGEPLALEEITSPELVFNVYPNPSSGIFNLEFSNSNFSTLNIQVYDTLGQVVYLKNIDVNNSSNSINQIDISDKNNGLYFIQIRVDDKFYSKQIMLNK